MEDGDGERVLDQVDHRRPGQFEQRPVLLRFGRVDLVGQVSALSLGHLGEGADGEELEGLGQIVIHGLLRK